MGPFHIFGAGGIGLALAVSLHKAGLNVLLVEKNSKKIDYCNAHGVILNNQHFPIKILPFDLWKPIPNAIHFLCVKCYDNSKILEKIPTQAILIPIQNGFDQQLSLHPLAGEGIASFISECTPFTTKATITRAGKLHLGPLQPWANLKLLSELNAHLKEGGLDSYLVSWSLPYKNTKLMYNAAISPLTSAGGLENSALLKAGKLRTLFFRLLLENYTILKAANQPLGTLGPMHPSKVAWLLKTQGLGEMLAPFFRPSLKQTYCSMFNDIAMGETEIDNYNGHLSRLAKAFNTPSPINDHAVSVIENMSLNRCKGSSNWLASLLDPF